MVVAVKRVLRNEPNRNERPMNKTRNNARFDRNGCYTCRCCKKQTRETGRDESSIRMCACCFEKSACQNSVSDNGPAGDAFEGPTYMALEAATTVQEVDAIFRAFCERNGI